MKTIEIIGYKRANLGKADAKKLREEGNVPCVVYGAEGQVHFYAPMILFRPLIYTHQVYFVDLNIEGEKYQAILQDVQFHPVSDIILHADFLILHEGKPIKMGIPVEFTGSAPGLLKGGKLQVKLRKVLIKALPKNMPENITLDISRMDLGDTIKIKEVEAKNFEILNSPQVTICTVAIPRLTRMAEEEEAAAALEEEEAALAEAEEEEGGATEEGGEAPEKGGPESEESKG